MAPESSAPTPLYPTCGWVDSIWFCVWQIYCEKAHRLWGGHFSHPRRLSKRYVTSKTSQSRPFLLLLHFAIGAIKGDANVSNHGESGPKDKVIDLSKERSVSHHHVSAHRYADPILRSGVI